MQYCDEILRRRFVPTQRELFAHPYGQFGTATGPALIFLSARAGQLSA
jgi:hypothetical protein